MKNKLSKKIFDKKELILGLLFIFLVFFILYRIVPMTLDGWASKATYPLTGGFINYIVVGIKNLYMTCNGRVISNIFCGILESFSSEIPLDIFNALSLVVTFQLLYKINKKQIKNKSAIIYGSLLFTALILLISAEMRQEVLFYANMAYVVPIPLIVLYYFLFKKYYEEESNIYILYMCLTGFSIGMWMEHIAAGFAATVSLLSLFLLIKKYKHKWKMILPAFLTDLGFLLMLASPGLKANRTITNSVPFLDTVIGNFKILYVDIVSKNLVLFLVLFMILFFITLAKKNKKAIDYIYMILTSILNALIVSTMLYRNFGTHPMTLLDTLFPVASYLATFKGCLLASGIIIILMLFGIFNKRNAEKKFSKNIYVYLLMICFISLGPILITPNTGARISSIAFFMITCITLVLYFELSNMNEKINKYIEGLIIILVLLALDGTIIIGRRIYDVTEKRERILNTILEKQEMNEWDYSQYAFLPIYNYGDMFNQAVVSQASIHYTVLLQAYGLDQRTNIIFTNHYVSAVNGISVKDNKLHIETNLKNKEQIKYKITYGTSSNLNVIDDTGWIQDDYETEAKSGYYLIEAFYRLNENSEEIVDRYEIIVS